MDLSQLFRVLPCVFVCLCTFISSARSQEITFIDGDFQKIPEQSDTVSEQRSSNVDFMFKVLSSHPTSYNFRTKRIGDALLLDYSWSKKLEHVEKRESNSTAIDSAANLSDNISQQQHRNRSSPNVNGERQVVIPTEHEESQDPSLRIFVISASIITVVVCVGVTLLVLVLRQYRHVCRR